MAIVLRVIGAIWVLMTVKTIWFLCRSIFTQGLNFEWGLVNILSLAMFAGGIGLLFLKAWGRWILLLGAIAYLLILTGPSFLQFKLGPVVLRHLVFYGIFIAILLIPQAKSATR